MSLTLRIVTHVTLSLTLHILTIDCINSLRPRSEILFVLHKTKLIEIDIKMSLITILAFINEIKIFTYSSLTLHDDHHQHNRHHTIMWIRDRWI